MRVMSVFCTNCGASVQLDEHNKVGFCSYCGSQLLLDDEKQRIELSGNVSISGMLTLDQQIKSVETLCKLGQYGKANTILEKLTHEYPEDYRVWWFCAYEALSKPYDIQKFEYGENYSRHFSAVYFDRVNARIVEPIENINYALTLAPEEEKRRLGILASKWLASFIPYFDWAEERTAIFFEYIETYKDACKESELKYKLAKKSRARNKSLAIGIPICLFFVSLILGSIFSRRDTSSFVPSVLLLIVFLFGLNWAQKTDPVDHPWSWYRAKELNKALPISEEQYQYLFAGTVESIVINDEIFKKVQFETPSIEEIQSCAKKVKNLAEEYLKY